MDIKCKRIIDGKTYNTETSTEIEGWDDDEGPFEFGEHLFQNRFGAFFLYKYREGFGHENDYQIIEPCVPDQARAWLEKYRGWETDLIESLFGEMPEAGSGEIKYTLRLPESLRDRLAALAKDNKQSLNAWMVKCLEACAASTVESSAKSTRAR